MGREEGGGAFCVGFGAWMIRRADAEAETGHQLPYLNMQFQFPKNTIPVCNTQLTRPSCLPLHGEEEGVVRDEGGEFRGVGKRQTQRQGDESQSEMGNRMFNWTQLKLN